MNVEMNAFSRKVSGVVRQVGNPSMAFSNQRSGVMKALLALDAQRVQFPEALKEAGLLDFHIELLLAAERPRESIARLNRALDLNESEAFLSREEVVDARCWLAFCYAISRKRNVARSIFEALTRQLAECEVTFRVMGMRHIGYMMHEAGMYEDALSHNKALMEAMPPNEEMIEDKYIVWRNIAENLYCLRRAKEAAKVLEEILNDAERISRFDTASEISFKLGVLSYESRRNEVAIEWMRRAVDLAGKTGSRHLLASAEENLEVLFDRIKRDSP